MQLSTYFTHKNKTKRMEMEINQKPNRRTISSGFELFSRILPFHAMLLLLLLPLFFINNANFSQSHCRELDARTTRIRCAVWVWVGHRIGQDGRAGAIIWENTRLQTRGQYEKTFSTSQLYTNFVVKVWMVRDTSTKNRIFGRPCEQIRVDERFGVFSFRGMLLVYEIKPLLLLIFSVFVVLWNGFDHLLYANGLQVSASMELCIDCGGSTTGMEW